MAEPEMITPGDAARRLGVATTTLYDWLGRSRRGLLVLNGIPVRVTYYQTGSRGQGRIRIPGAEIERLLEVMRVKAVPVPTRHPPLRRDRFPGITVPLGRPR